MGSRTFHPFVVGMIAVHVIGRLTITCFIDNGPKTLVKDSCRERNEGKGFGHEH
jgi:hypothetical protein